jgi:DNA repair protein RadA/Sms
MAKKNQTNYVCSDCGSVSSKWMGQCSDCKAWNTLVESVAQPEASSANRFASWTGTRAKAVDLKDVKSAEYPRMDTGLEEFNRVLGGGLVPGSVVLIGGDPGIGKSTLLLQALAFMGREKKVVYVAGEESPQQVKLRAERLGLGETPMQILPEIELEKILMDLEEGQPCVAVIDSIQTVYSGALQSAPGTVAQVRECAAHLTRLAKSKNISLILVGHVTKEGTLAGPRVLEHIVDTVLYFEGEEGSSFRMIRAMKNRFGSANELGVFSMGEQGLEEVSNPSSMFLTAHEKPVSGSCILTAMEGNRPFLVEVQALVEDAPTPNPKRYASGVDVGRLQMLLAVLNKHTGIVAHDQNVYIKVVGGVRLTEPAADLAVLLSAHSSLVNRPLPEGLIVFGEVGLAGELRAVSNAETRLKEAVKLGFKHAIIPAQCKLRKPIDGISVTAVTRVDHAINCLRDVRDLKAVA